MNTTSTNEERIWSILSHLSSLALGMGIVLPIVGWSDQRRKSNYASFQSLQALGYQSLGFTVWILSYLVILVAASIILLVMPGAEGNGGSLNAIPTPWLIGFSIVSLGFLVLYLLLPIIAAVACALGKDFHYPILGDRLARYLEYDPARKTDEPIWLNEDREFRWVTAAGHFSVLILLWGMLAPLTTWALYGKRSSFLKFQAIQTFVYQAGVTVLYAAGGVLYGVGLLALVVALGGIGQVDSRSSPGIVGMILAGALLLLGMVVILAIPLLHILGQWAGYRVLKGDHYRYPLLGRWVEKWIAQTSIREEKPV